MLLFVIGAFFIQILLLILFYSFDTWKTGKAIVWYSKNIIHRKQFVLNLYKTGLRSTCISPSISLKHLP